MKDEIEYIKIPKYYKDMILYWLKEQWYKVATREKTENGYWYVSKNKKAKRLERIIKYLQKLD